MAKDILYIGTLYGSKLRKDYSFATMGYAIQKFNYNMVRAINKFGNITILSPVYTNSVIPYEEHSDDFSYRYVKCNGIIGRVSSLFTSITMCLKGNASIVIADALNISMTLGAIIAKRFKGKVLLLTVTDIPEDVLEQKKTMLSRLFLLSLKKADGFVFLTEQTNFDFNKKNKPYVIVEGIASDSSVKIVDKKTNICVYAGGITEKNCIKQMVDAFDAVARGDECLLLFGDGTEKCKTYVKKIASHSQHIKYMGPVDNETVLEYESKARLLINPRTNTGSFTKYSFPSKFIEYLNSGTASLVQALDGVPEEYTKHALLFSGISKEDYEESIRNALNMSDDELRVIGNNAKIFIQAKNGYTTTANKIKSLIEIVYAQMNKHD